MSATTTKSRVSYKKLLTEATELRGQSGVMAHRRATILCQLFDDADFRAEVGASDDFKVREFLDTLVDDLCLEFLEMRAMLAEFPEQADWADGKLATLYSKAEEKIAARKTATPTQRSAKRTVVTREQYDALKEEKTDAEARLKFVEKQNTQAIDRMTQLERENADLRAENERLKGRIEQLERMAGGGRVGGQG